MDRSTRGGSMRLRSNSPWGSRRFSPRAPVSPSSAARLVALRAAPARSAPPRLPWPAAGVTAILAAQLLLNTLGFIFHARQGQLPK